MPHMKDIPITDHHGPAEPGGMVPGQRASLMVMVEDPDMETAIRSAQGWVDAFHEDCGLVIDVDATELYAIGRAADLREHLTPPQRHTPDLQLDFICTRGTWTHPGTCAPAPPDSNDATAWAWAYYNALMDAGEDALCTIWDVHPLPAAS